MFKKTIKNQKKKHEFKFEKWEHRSNMSQKKYKIKFIFKCEEHIQSYRTEWNPVHTELNEIGKLQNKSNQT